MTKKTPISALAGALALLVGGHAFAEPPPSSELKVTGMLEVPGCDVAIDGQSTRTATYDFGDILPSQIKPGKNTSELTAQFKEWTITCTGKTFLTYNVTDNREGTESAFNNQYFGLGNVNETGKIGYYKVTMSGATVGSDGNTPIATSVFATNSPTFTTVASTPVAKAGYKMGWATAANKLAAGEVFGARMTVAPILAGTTDMNGTLKEDTALDGSLTLNFEFGI